MTKQLLKQAPVDIAFDLGAAAYGGGYPSSSNPYDREMEAELFRAWADGWRHERNYYERKL
ncbi:hypothetical protein [Nitrosomonas sp.]|uniref:hypothetical protein n=1 Tax=Nitrosomonas sp. TaxID=42353 RepID=UPI0025D3AF9E|nr:hypothetical protein [Nitrosomonas sp.]